MDLPNIALFGYGYWGKKIATTLKHYAKFVVVDPFINDLPADIPTATLAEVCANSAIVACIVATPESTHFELADQLLKAGKHVWVEKPLCLTVDQSQQLILTARRLDRVLFVDTIFLFDPLAWLVADWINKQTSPIITWKSSRFSNRKPQEQLTPIDDLAIHDSYLLRWWFGKHELMVCTVRDNSNYEQEVKLDLQSPENRILTCSWHYSFGNPTSTRMIELTTAEGSLQWGKQDGSETLGIKKGNRVAYSGIFTRATALNRAVEVFLLLVQHHNVHSTTRFFDRNSLNTQLLSMIYSSELNIQDTQILAAIRDAKKSTS